MCEMRKQIAQMWQSAGQKADRKIVQKSVYFAKRSMSTIRLLQSVRQANPTELVLAFHLKTTSNT